MKKYSLKPFFILMLAMSLLFVAGKARAVSDGEGNEIFPGVNVGIGTTAPSARLEIVDGSVRIISDPATAVIDHAAAEGMLYIQGDFEVDGKIYGDGSQLTGLSSGSGTVNPGAQGYFSYYPAAGTTVDDQTVLFTDGTNIGIGSSAPQEKLDVRGHLRVGGAIFAEDNIWSSSCVLNEGVSCASTDVNLGAGYTAGQTRIITFSTNNGGAITERGRVTANGNFGIGTTAPLALLQVGINPTIPAGSLPAEAVKGNLVVDGKIYGDGSALTGISAISGLTDNYITRANGTSAIENSIMYDTGANIGIGTIVPSQKLDVSGAVNAQYYYLYGEKMFGPNFTDFEINNNSWYTKMAFFTNALSRMVIDGSGNVGIGTSVPVVKLHLGPAGSAPNLMPVTGNDLYVQGNIEFDGRIYGDGGGLTNLAGTLWDAIGDPSGSGSIAFGATVQTMDWATANTQAALTLTSNALTTGELLTLSHTTSVIADGGSMLRVTSTSNDTGGATNGVLLDLSSTASTAGTQFLQTYSALTTGTGQRIVANALTSGNGLSVTSSSAALTGDLAVITASGNNAGVTGSALKVGLTGGTSTTGTALNVTTAGGAGSFGIRVNDDGTYTDTTPFVVNYEGNVGLGTTAPVALLHVGAGTPNAMPATGRDAYINGNLEIDGRIYGGIVYSKSVIITNPTSASDAALWRTPVAITIVAIHGVQVGGTNIIGTLTECDANGLNPVVVDSTDMTITTSNVNDDGSLSNPSLDAGDYLGWQTTSVSGAVTRAVITFEYTIN